MVFLDNSHPPLQRFVACVRWKTIKYREQPDGGDGRSAWAVDDEGKTLTLAAIGRILHMELPQVSKACKEAEALGVVRREGKKIFLVGDCPAPDMGKVRRNVNCTDNLPPSLVREIEGWPAERKTDFYSKWELAVNHVNNIHANRVAEDRAEAIQLYDSILGHFGLERNHLPPRRTVKPIEIPQQLRLFLPRAAAPGGYLYKQPDRTDHKSPVRTNPSILMEERTERVSTNASSSSVAVQQLAAALRIDDDAATELWLECSELDATLTVAELVAMGQQKLRQTVRTVRNPTGLLLNALPKMVKAHQREKARQALKPHSEPYQHVITEEDRRNLEYEAASETAGEGQRAWAREELAKLDRARNVGE